MIKVYAAYNYPPFLKGIVRDLRVIWALEELGLPYQVEWLDTSQGEHHTAEYRQLNPFGKIPALKDGELSLFESGAIVNYLFERAGRIAPTNAERARNHAWCSCAARRTTSRQRGTGGEREGASQRAGRTQIGRASCRERVCVPV